MQKVIITGGTGLVGRHLVPILEQSGYQASVLSRAHNKGDRSLYWEPSKMLLDKHALEQCNVIIHLSGASIAGGRWTNQYKKLILNSRIESTRLLYERLKKDPAGVSTFISASAIGIYGNAGENSVDENSASGNDFLATTCKQWEQEVQKIAALGIRVVIIRTGLVLAKDGGILPVMARPVKFGLGAILGSGNQFMSWIHIRDLCRIYLKAVGDASIKGIYNGTAPNPVRHQDFMKSLAARCHRPLWLPAVPAWLLKIALGEKSALVLGGQKVASEKIIQAGFEFEYSELDPALKELLKHS